MNALLTVWRGSERIGFVPTVLCAIAWLVCGAIGAREAVASLWQTPRLAQIVGIAIATVVGIGGLVSFWLIADHVDYLRRGYRVRWVTGSQWLYEERVSKGAERCLPCVRVILGNGYPAPSEVRIPSEASWESGAPVWAKGRRTEIVQRIAECFGSDRGGDIRFVDA
jgi:hypothetical protein